MSGLCNNERANFTNLHSLIFTRLKITVRAEGSLLSIVVSLSCTLYLCGSLIVSWTSAGSSY